MLKYFLLMGLLLISAAACTTTAAEETTPQIIESEEAHEDEHDEDNHDDEHESDEAFRDHDAHEHGAAELMIAWSGNELAIDLQTPAYNVLGFEYAPASDAEKALLEERVEILEAGTLLQFSPDANCTLIAASVETELDEEHEDTHEDKEAEHEEHEDDEVHSDIAASYNVQCEQPDKLESLDVSKLFSQFPNFEDLRAQWISDTAQSAKALTADDPVLTLK
ncbi:MAG: DUF2796 domain-containing protein [Chloroflexi bacterium]|nr:DUF2796 domain-containing protein [Chloroflexota bacterium]